jgi:hypothetical protein
MTEVRPPQSTADTQWDTSSSTAGCGRASASSRRGTRSPSRTFCECVSGADPNPRFAARFRRTAQIDVVALGLLCVLGFSAASASTAAGYLELAQCAGYNRRCAMATVGCVLNWISATYVSLPVPRAGGPDTRSLSSSPSRCATPCLGPKRAPCPRLRQVRRFSLPHHSQRAHEPRGSSPR